MLNIKETIILGSCGLTIAVCVIGGIYQYGQYKYYSGKVDRDKEVMPILETLRDELYKQKEFD